MNRPEVCADLLNEALPKMPGVPGRFWMRGYVWRGGFTIQRVTPWANGLRAVGTGRFESGGPLTQITFRVGLGRYQAYGLAFLLLIFTGFGAAGSAAVVATRSLNYVLVLSILPILLTLAFALTAGRRPRRDGQRSEEADRLLEFLRNAFGAEVRQGGAAET